MARKTDIFDTELEIAALGIIAIVVLEFAAIVKGIDGTTFGAAVAGIGGIIGWVFKGWHYKRKNHK